MCSRNIDEVFFSLQQRGQVQERLDRQRSCSRVITLPCSRWGDVCCITFAPVTNANVKANLNPKSDNPYPTLNQQTQWYSSILFVGGIAGAIVTKAHVRSLICLMIYTTNQWQWVSRLFHIHQLGQDHRGQLSILSATLIVWSFKYFLQGLVLRRLILTTQPWLLILCFDWSWRWLVLWLHTV